MAGLNHSTPTPTEITVHQQSRVLEVAFSDGARFRIPFELMRVYSPSAEVKGHGPGQEVLQTGKRLVEVVALEPVGNYAVQPTFSDGHNTGKPNFQGFALSLTAKTEAEADKLFGALADGGQVQMPLTKTFFSPKFGMVADKFGVGWMVLVAQ